MNITNEITDGMTPQEKEVYFAHMEKRHREEMEKLAHERKRLQAYRELLIKDIMKGDKGYTIAELHKLPIRSLEEMLF